MNENSVPKLSACIITYQEEDRIAACLASLDFCQEWIVVDSHSRDQTRAIAAGLGARVIERDWPGHVAQKEFAIRAASHDWVLCLDADEQVSPELRTEILRLRDAGFLGHAGWRMPRMSRYLGRWIRHGTWYPDLQLRLFDRRKGHWGGHDPHDRVELNGSIGRLRGDLLHEPYRSISHHLQKIDQYTTTMAAGALARGKRAHLGHLLINPWVRFVRFYFLHAGFLEGWRGLVLASLAAHYVRLKYTKMLVAQRVERGS